MTHAEFIYDCAEGKACGGRGGCREAHEERRAWNVESCFKLLSVSHFL